MTTAEPQPTDTDSDSLHAGLVDHLVARGTVHTAAIEAALRKIARHPFVPEVSPATAYAPDDAVVTKRADDGSALSSASAPGVVAGMLEQLTVRPGMRILEIGAGTGYNAALLAELVGPEGHIVTIDIDQDVVDRARTALATAGYPQVEVLCGDGAQGHAPGGPYDGIVITAGAWDLFPKWWEQLAPSGRLVIPLLLGTGTSRSIAFVRDGEHLTSQSMISCGFLGMRGVGARPEPSFPLAEGVRFVGGEAGQSPEALTAALAGDAVRTWTGIVLPTGQPFRDLDLWLTTTSGPGFCRISATPEAIAADVADPAFRWGGAAVTYGEGSLAYLTIRPAEPVDGAQEAYFELGVRAHGPHRDDVAARLTEQIQCWHTGPSGTSPRIDAYLRPADIPDGITIIEKPFTRLTVTW